VRFILVIERKHLFPGLSPQGFLPPDTVDLAAVAPRLFFAERDFMETSSHFKQIIPYLILKRGESATERVLAYQRRVAHSEQRLGGLWSIGFGGHVEPLDRGDREVTSRGLVLATAKRELAEETGLNLAGERFTPVGFINSDREDVSSVHFGVVFVVDLENFDGGDEEILATVTAQAEPNRACWIAARDLPGKSGPERGPEGGTFEDWSRIAIEGIFPAERPG